MMLRAAASILLLTTISVLAEEEPMPRASVVDSNINRTPEHTVAPQYPRKARRDRLEGKVQVCFEINRKGRPRRVAVRTSTHRVFERPSIVAVKASSFKALNSDENLPPIKSCRTFVFSLEPAEI